MHPSRPSAAFCTTLLASDRLGTIATQVLALGIEGRRQHVDTEILSGNYSDVAVTPGNPNTEYLARKSVGPMKEEGFPSSPTLLPEGEGRREKSRKSSRLSRPFSFGRRGGGMRGNLSIGDSDDALCPIDRPASGALRRTRNPVLQNPPSPCIPNLIGTAPGTDEVYFVLFIATESRIYKSANNGKNWSSRLRVDEQDTSDRDDCDADATCGDEPFDVIWITGHNTSAVAHCEDDDRRVDDV